MNLIRFVGKGWRILSRRMREQGWRVTLVWMFARGIPKITGVPLLRYSEVTPQLYVGPQYNRKGHEYLIRQGFTHGVNLRIEYDDAAHGLALPGYCYLPTVDDDAPTMEHLQEGVRFIAEAVQAGGKVYVHCAGGIGRAPTMAAAYLMAEQGLSLADALALIRRNRPFITIMPPQMAQLERYEQSLTSARGVGRR